MPTASGLQRVLACPASELLPHVRRTSAAADAGTARHKYLENVGPLGRDAALELVADEHREMCAAIDLSGLPTDLASEVAFCYDWTTGTTRELGRGLDRDYSACSATEIPGTIDALGIAAESVYVGDYKGFSLVDARDNAQLLFAAMCASRVYGKGSATVEIINIRHGANWRSACRVDAFDLAAFGLLVSSVMRQIDDHRIAGTVPEVTEGKHCRYCPAFDSCPAKTALIRRMANGQSGDELEMMTPLTPETASHAYQVYRQMVSLTKRAGDILRAYASERPIDIGNGAVFGRREKPGNEKIDGDIAYRVIRDAFGQDAADVAVKRTATKSGIDKAIREAPGRAGTLKANRDRVLGEIRDLGGARRKTITTIDEHRAEITEGE